MRGHEYVSPEKDSKSQKALYPDEYFAYVDLATAELTREEKVLQLTVESGPFMAITGSGRDCILSLFAPVYLSNLCPGGKTILYLPIYPTGVQDDPERKWDLCRCGGMYCGYGIYA